MKKIFKIAYSVIFFAACSAPLIAFPFMQNNEQIEKKELAEKPEIIEKGKLNTDFSEEFEAWYNDRLPFRTELLTGANFINAEILSSPSANVIQGKDGWLFYEKTVPDFMNINELSNKDISRIVTTLSLMQENVNNKGGKFLFVPVPNKNSVYDEYMPDCYTREEENNLSRLQQALVKSEVNFLDMKKALTDQKAIGLYHKRDTHWNNFGALIGFNAIMDKLGYEHKSYDSVSYTITDNWRGDLDKMLYPIGGFMDNQYIFDIEYDDFMFTYPVGVTDTQKQLENFMSDKEDNDHRFQTQKTSPTNGSRLFMVRDSFGRALLPFMIDNYDNATFVRTNSPNMSMVGNNTDMIYEIVERNLSELISTAPFMMAPQRQVEITGERASENNRLFASQEAYGFRIYGVADDEFVSTDTRIYVKLENDTNSYIYEAFPIYEEELLSDEKLNSRNGFSMVIDTAQIESGEYTASLISDNVSSGIIENINIKGE